MLIVVVVMSECSIFIFFFGPMVNFRDLWTPFDGNFKAGGRLISNDVSFSRFGSELTSLLLPMSSFCFSLSKPDFVSDTSGDSLSLVPWSMMTVWESGAFLGCR